MRNNDKEIKKCHTSDLAVKMATLSAFLMRKYT